MERMRKGLGGEACYVAVAVFGQHYPVREGGGYIMFNVQYSIFNNILHLLAKG